MPCISPLLPQSGVLLSDQLHHQGGMAMDKREKTGTVQSDQRQGGQRSCIAAVELVGGNQIFVKEQLTGAVADAISGPTAEFHNPLLNNINGLNRFATTEHTSSGGQRQTISFKMLTDQL